MKIFEWLGWGLIGAVLAVAIGYLSGSSPGSLNRTGGIAEEGGSGFFERDDPSCKICSPQVGRLLDTSFYGQDSLRAKLAAMQVFAGDVDGAVKTTVSHPDKERVGPLARLIVSGLLGSITEEERASALLFAERMVASADVDDGTKGYVLYSAGALQLGLGEENAAKTLSEATPYLNVMDEEQIEKMQIALAIKSEKEQALFPEGVTQSRHFTVFLAAIGFLFATSLKPILESFGKMMAHRFGVSAQKKGEKSE